MKMMLKVCKESLALGRLSLGHDDQIVEFIMSYLVRAHTISHASLEEGSEEQVKDVYQEMSFYSSGVCICLCAQSCLTLCHPVDCSPPGSSICGIFQTRILEWVAMPSSWIFLTQ